MKVCIFCGSSSGVGDKYTNEAIRISDELSNMDADLVYGGASIGVMGTFADQFLKNNRKVYGVIPNAIIDLEIAHEGLTELYTVDGMHERKKKMYDLSDCFVAFPGGYGTLDELCEIVTWAQLLYHKKPVYLYNAFGFFDSFIDHINKASEEGFISKEHLSLIKVISRIDEIAKS